jgi:hypothetical protein
MHARAQDGVTWDPPVNLSNSETSSEMADLVADPYGMVHVFWGENIIEARAYPNAILYRRWDGQAWSAASDVLLAPEGIEAQAARPSVALGQKDEIYLVFSGGWSGGIYFSAAPIWQAAEASAWRKPRLLNEQVPGDEARIAVAPDGTIHVVFCVTTGLQQGIYHTRSEDGGRTWMPPQRILDSLLGPDAAIFQLRMAVDSGGALHTTWARAAYPDSYPPKGVLYAKSDDGQSWSSPEPIADGLLCCPEVVVGAHDDLHLLWSGTGDQRFKFEAQSTDGGLTWSQPFRFPHLGGYHGPASAAVDGAGVLHVVMGTAYEGISPDVLVHSQWDGRGWSEPEVLLTDMYPNPETGTSLTSPDIGVTEGNILHIVVTYPVVRVPGTDQQFEIYYLRGQTQAAQVSPAPRPTSLSAEEGVKEPGGLSGPTTVPASPAPAAETASAEPNTQPERSGAGPLSALSVGFVSVVVVLLGAALIVRWRR